MSNVIAAPESDTAKPSGWLRAYLIVIAVLEVPGGLIKIPVLFGGNPDVPGPGWGGWAVTSELALTLPFALIALVFLIRSDDRRAISFIAGISMLKWISLLPSFVNHPLEYPGMSFVVVDVVFRMLIWPVLAAIIFILCWKNERLALAGVLAGLPTVMETLGMALFAIAVMIYGF